MSKARSNQHNQIDSVVWARINKKIDSIRMERIYQIVKGIDNFLEQLNTHFTLNNTSVELLEKKGLRDWTNLYTDIIPLQTLQLFFEVSLLAKQSPADFLHPIDSLKKSIPNFDKYFDRNKIEAASCNIILPYRLFLLDSLCFLNNGKNMYKLIQEARNGNDSSLFKAIAIDKALLTTDWVSIRIRKETLRTNSKFFRELSAALNKKLDITKTKSSIQQAFFLTALWSFGLKTLSDQEMCVLMSKLNVYNTNPDTLRVTRNRLGLTHSKLQKN